VKIIFVNRYFYPDHSATSQLLSDLVFSLSKQGLEIEVITSRQLYDNASARLNPLEIVNNVKIIRIWATIFGRRNLLGRAIDYLSFYIMCAIKLLLIAESDNIIVSKTDPPLVSEIVSCIARLKRIKTVNWLQDLFPEAAVALKVSGIKGPLEKLLKFIRNASLRYASENVTIGFQMSEKIRAMGVRRDSIKVIHNWADGDFIEPIIPDKNILRHKWGLNSKIVVGYSGNMGRDHEFRTIINAAQNANFYEKVVFLFIGNGIKKEWIRAEALKKGLINFIFKPYQPREILNQSLTAPDIHFISFRPELEGLAVPSKFYGAIATGRPILYVGDLNGEIAKIISETGCGFTIKIGDNDKMVDCLKRLIHSKELRESMGELARLTFEKYYDKSIAIDNWRNIFSKLNSTKNRVKN
jgi:glycosyltransferase involved in cell wall biosynthesis